MKKRLLSLVLAVVLGLGICATAGAAELFDHSVYLKQQTRSTCTLASATMLLRRKALLDGDAGWSAITEAAVRKVAWTSGLAWNFTYNGVHISVLRKSGGWAGNSLDSKRQALADLLTAHPEGIVAYATSQPHAVLLTDYDWESGIFYCCDPAQYYPEGRIPLTRSSLKGGSQDAILRNITQLWYAADGVSKGAGTVQPLLAPAAQAELQEEPQAEDTVLAAVREVEVDGVKVALQMCSRKDELGNDVNFVKLRDMAQVLSGSEAQFDVGFDGTVCVATGAAYETGAEGADAHFDGLCSCSAPVTRTTVDGQEVALEAIQLTDETGGGHIYYNLRDLGQTVGFQVDWDPDAGIRIDTAVK